MHSQLFVFLCAFWLAVPTHISAQSIESGYIAKVTSELEVTATNRHPANCIIHAGGSITVVGIPNDSDVLVSYDAPQQKKKWSIGQHLTYCATGTQFLIPKTRLRAIIAAGKKSKG
jgi:hypothetical protein